MIKMIKFMEKMWLMLAIITFLIGVYWAINQMVYDALYFFGFSVISIGLFLWRRMQRRQYEKEE